MKKNLTLVFNRSELGAGTRGSSLGIDSILIEASKRMKSFFIETPSLKISDKNQFLFKKSKYKWAKYAEPLIDVYKDISEKIENQLADDNIVEDKVRSSIRSVTKIFFNIKPLIDVHVMRVF